MDLDLDLDFDPHAGLPPDALAMASGLAALPPSLEPPARLTPAQALALQQAKLDALAARPTADASERRDDLSLEATRQGFDVGPIGLAVRYDEASELIELRALHRLPHAPAWLLGVSNFHGVPLPVVDLAELLGLGLGASQAPGPTGTTPHLLVLGRGSEAVALRIQGIPQRLRWTPLEGSPADLAPSSLQGLLRGACRVGDRLWFDLDVSGLLARLDTLLA